MGGKGWPAIPSVPHCEVWGWDVVGSPSPRIVSNNELKMGLGLGVRPYFVSIVSPSAAIPVVLVFNLEFISLGLFVRMGRGKIVDAAFHVVHATLEAMGESLDIRSEGCDVPGDGDLVVTFFFLGGGTAGFVDKIFVAHVWCGKWCCGSVTGSVII